MIKVYKIVYFATIVIAECFVMLYLIYIQIAVDGNSHIHYHEKVVTKSIAYFEIVRDSIFTLWFMIALIRLLIEMYKSYRWLFWK